MFEPAKEKIVGKFGDFLQSPRKGINKLFEYVTMGSIPERNQSECGCTPDFCRKLQQLEMTGFCRNDS